MSVLVRMETLGDASEPLALPRLRHSHQAFDHELLGNEKELVNKIRLFHLQILSTVAKFSHEFFGLVLGLTVDLQLDLSAVFFLVLLSKRVLILELFVHGSRRIFKTLLLHLGEIGLLLCFLLSLGELLALALQLVTLRALKRLVIQSARVGNLDEMAQLGTLKLNLAVELAKHEMFVLFRDSLALSVEGNALRAPYVVETFVLVRKMRERARSRCLYRLLSSKSRQFLRGLGKNMAVLALEFKSGLLASGGCWL